MLSSGGHVGKTGANLRSLANRSAWLSVNLPAVPDQKRRFGIWKVEGGVGRVVGSGVPEFRLGAV